MSKHSISPFRMLRTLSRYGEVFATVGKWQLTGLVALSAFAALLEGVGISMFVPLLSPDSVGVSSPGSNVTKMIAQIFSLVGLKVSIVNTLILIISFFIGKGIVKMFETRLRGRLVANFHANSQKDLFKKICKLRFEKFLMRNRGSLTNLLSTETQNAAQALTDYTQTISAIATAFAYSMLAVTLSWRLAVAGVVCGLIMLLLQKPISRRISGGSYQLAKIRKETGSEIFEAFSNFKYLRGSNSIEVYAKKIFKLFEVFRIKKIEVSDLDGLWAGINQPLSVLTLVTLIYWDSSTNGTSVLGSLVSLGIIYRVMGALNNLLGMWNNFSLNRGHLDYTIKEDADLTQDQDAEPIFIEGLSWSQDLHIENLSIQIKTGEYLLNDISLDIKYGDFIAIVGTSGSGKSTLLDALIGLHHCQVGKFFFNNKEVSAETLATLRSDIGFVTQEVPIFNGTILENITMYQDKDSIDIDWVYDCIKNTEMSFIHQLSHDIHTVVGEGGVTLSGGQKQRLGIARELYKRPKILFLDEATSALDADNETRILNHLSKFKKDMSIIVITHRLSTLENATNIYVLDNGKIVESGNFQRLKSSQRSLFAKLLHSDDKSQKPAVRMVPKESLSAWAEVIESGQPPIKLRIANISESGIGLNFLKATQTEALSPGKLLDLCLNLGDDKVTVVARVIHQSSGLIGMRYIDNHNPELKRFLKRIAECQKIPLAA